MEKKDQDVNTRLEDSMEEAARQNLLSTIEIKNIPPELDEEKDLSEIAMNVLQSMNIKITRKHIKRICRYNGDILLKLSSVGLKKNILNAVKQYNIHHKNPLNLNMLGIESYSPIYITECLTPKARRLHSLGRELVKQNRFKYCWTREGEVYLRKSEKSDPILISNEKQIEELKKKK